MIADFKFFLAHTLKLCAATIEFGDDSKEADEIRNAMDTGDWHRLSDKEQEALRYLSAEIDAVEWQMTAPTRRSCRCGVCQECNWAERHE